VEYLLGRGFIYLIVSLNYSGNWDTRALGVLKRQFLKLAELYERLTLQEKKFYISPFEVKLATHIMGKDARCQRCALAQRQVSVAPDGTVYPCVQFVKDGIRTRDYAIGSVFTGFDEAKRARLYRESLKSPDACSQCAMSERCNHTCSCLNWQTTGSLHDVAPVVCETERMLLPIVDNLGESLYRKRAPAFIQKHYNPAYPLLSLMEDLSYMP
jgi:uncharacterized protein